MIYDLNKHKVNMLIMSDVLCVNRNKLQIDKCMINTSIKDVDASVICTTNSIEECERVSNTT